MTVKVLPPELTFGHGVDRFLREAKTAATLDHPNIIPIYRIASGGKLFWYAMKYLEGRSLEDVLRERGTFTVEETVEILEQVVNGGEELWVKIIDVDLERRRISLSIKQAAEGGTVAAEYQDAFGEHAFDEAGNYIGEPITADEPASEDDPVASEAPQVTDVSETLPEAVLETVPETVLETVPETPEAIEENPEIAPEA